MLRALVLGNTITLVTLRTRTRWLCGLPRLPILIAPSRGGRPNKNGKGEITVATLMLSCTALRAVDMYDSRYRAGAE